MERPDRTATHRSAPIVVRTEAELVRAVRDADAAGIALRVAGPATAAALEDFEGRVIQVATGGMTVNDDGCSMDSLAFCGGVQVTVGAGQDWPAFVALAVDHEWVGLERLAGYPGTVGGATIRNVQAYGQSVSDTVAAVRTWDRATGSHRRFAMVDCRFDEHGSILATERLADGSRRYVVLDVAFLLRQGDLTEPIRDPDLARLLRLDPGQRAPLSQAMEAVRCSTAR